jgi:hypothetical protein
MQQVSQLHQRDSRFGAQVSRLLHGQRAAWWFGLLFYAGFAHFVSVIVLLMGFYVFMTAFQHRQQPELSPGQNWSVLALSALVAVAAAVYCYRTMNEDDFGKPPRKHISRKWWRVYATGTGAMVAIGTAYASFFMWVLLLAGLVRATRLMVSSFVLPGHLGLWFAPVPAGLALWAFIAWRYQFLEWLEKGEPIGLRLAANLVQHADAFQERARVLEQAMEETVAISKQIQREIGLEQQQLGELREQYRRDARLKKLSDQEVAAVRLAIAQEQSRSTRWGLWWNLVIAVVFLVIGLVIQALINFDALGHQLRQWLHLG